MREQIVFGELEKSGEVGAMAHFKVLTWNSHGGTEEKHRKSQVRIVYVPDNIQTGHLPNTSQKCKQLAF
jgi:hypothetical protein